MNEITLDALKNTQVFAAAIQEIEEKKVAERKVLIDAVRQCQGVHPECEKLAKREVELTAELEDLTRRKRETEAELGNTRSRFWTLSDKSAAKRRVLEAQLRAGADQRIYIFMAWAEQAKNQAQISGAYIAQGYAMGITEKQIAAHSAGAKSAVKKTVQLIDTSLQRAEKMLLDAQTSAEVNAELSNMANEIHDAYQSIPNARSLNRNFEAR